MKKSDTYERQNRHGSESFRTNDFLLAAAKVLKIVLVKENNLKPNCSLELQSLCLLYRKCHFLWLEVVLGSQKPENLKMDLAS